MTDLLVLIAASLGVGLAFTWFNIKAGTALLKRFSAFGFTVGYILALVALGKLAWQVLQ